MRWHCLSSRAGPTSSCFPQTQKTSRRIVRLANEYRIPFLPRGAGTGLSGGALAVEGGIVIELQRMNRILSIDVENRIAVVQPGVVNLHISQAAAPYGLYYAPDPSSQMSCSIGGNVAENSGGPHCLKYGMTTNHILAIEAVTAEGEIIRLGNPAGEPVGMDLVGTIVGSEGTFVIVTEITIRLLPEAAGRENAAGRVSFRRGMQPDRVGRDRGRYCAVCARVRRCEDDRGR